MNRTEPKSVLAQITTNWSTVHEPSRFVMRYATAIAKYLRALIHNEHDAEEVAQEFLLRVSERGFAGADAGKGRFRDYLITSVRNTAINYFKRQARGGKRREEFIQHVAARTQPAAPAEQTWLDEWQRCILDRAWRALQRHERKSPESRLYTVLRVCHDHPDEDSKQQAARVSERSARPITPEAFRKQLSRARRQFAQLVMQEVIETLDEPTPHEIREELAAIGLLELLQPYLSEE